MIPHGLEPDPAEDVQTFTVPGDFTPDEVELVADQAGVPVTVVDGLYVATVPCRVGFLRYAAAVPADEQVSA
jgi:hypothetical protein